MLDSATVRQDLRELMAWYNRASEAERAAVGAQLIREGLARRQRDAQ